jgi:Cu/Ag efflux protein CusF
MAVLGWFVHRRWSEAAKPDYQGTGSVVALLPPPSALHQTRPVIIIHHDVVPGLMEESMSMPFVAASTKLFEGLRPGDRITFGMKLTPEALLVISIEREAAGRTQ